MDIQIKVHVGERRTLDNGDKKWITPPDTKEITITTKTDVLGELSDEVIDEALFMLKEYLQSR